MPKLITQTTSTLWGVKISNAECAAAGKMKLLLLRQDAQNLFNQMSSNTVRLPHQRHRLQPFIRNEGEHLSMEPLAHIRIGAVEAEVVVEVDMQVVEGGG